MCLCSSNSCVTTQTLYLEVLNYLLEFMVCGCGGVVLSEASCLQLQSVHGHSLKVCGSCSEDDESMLQRVHLLLMSIEYPLLLHLPFTPAHDVSHDQSCDLPHDQSCSLFHGTGVVLSVLNWTNDPDVVSLILDSRNLLEGHVGSGRQGGRGVSSGAQDYSVGSARRRRGQRRRGVSSGDNLKPGRVLDRLIRRAKQPDLDPDILPVVRMWAEVDAAIVSLAVINPCHGACMYSALPLISHNLLNVAIPVLQADLKSPSKQIFLYATKNRPIPSHYGDFKGPPLFKEPFSSWFPPSWSRAWSYIYASHNGDYSGLLLDWENCPVAIFVRNSWIILPCSFCAPIVRKFWFAWLELLKHKVQLTYS